jgi:hypothetical protein
LTDQHRTPGAPPASPDGTPNIGLYSQCERVMQMQSRLGHHCVSQAAVDKPTEVAHAL